jgi:hypothetical protein
VTIQENDLDLSLFGSFQAGELYIIYIYITYVCMRTILFILLDSWSAWMDTFVIIFSTSFICHEWGA